MTQQELIKSLQEQIIIILNKVMELQRQLIEFTIQEANIKTVEPEEIVGVMQLVEEEYRGIKMYKLSAATEDFTFIDMVIRPFGNFDYINIWENNVGRKWNGMGYICEYKDVWPDWVPDKCLNESFKFFSATNSTGSPSDFKLTVHKGRYIYFGYPSDFIISSFRFRGETSGIIIDLKD